MHSILRPSSYTFFSLKGTWEITCQPDLWKSNPQLCDKRICRLNITVCEIRRPVIGSWMIKRYKAQISLRTADVSPRSSPLRDASRRGTSATRRKKFHADEVNQCLHNKSGSHGVPNANLFNFKFSWSIFENCCVHLRISSHHTPAKLKWFL